MAVEGPSTPSLKLERRCNQRVLSSSDPPPLESQTGNAREGNRPELPSPPLLAPETAFQASQTLGNFSQDYNCISCSANFSCQLTENVVAAFFQEWTQQVQDILNTKKFGDIAFEDKEFKNAIEYYSKVRRYTFSLNSGAVEELELDSFGLSIMPSSLVSTYSLLVEDVLKVVSDACCGSQSCSVAYTKAFKGTFISIMKLPYILGVNLNDVYLLEFLQQV
ncbi:hypothetical protein AHAS_Ahas06G0148600 [Arachis hypogaea]